LVIGFFILLNKARWIRSFGRNLGIFKTWEREVPQFLIKPRELRLGF